MSDFFNFGISKQEQDLYFKNRCPCEDYWRSVYKKPSFDQKIFPDVVNRFRGIFSENEFKRAKNRSLRNNRIILANFIPSSNQRLNKSFLKYGKVIGTPKHEVAGVRKEKNGIMVLSEMKRVFGSSYRDVVDFCKILEEIQSIKPKLPI